MSMIITGKEKPYFCDNCPIKSDCSAANKEPYLRDPFCHLKSVDGLIKKMESCMQSHIELAGSEDSTVDITRELALAGAYSHCIHVIKEYCEIE